MSGAITILFFAWTINTIVGDVNTGKYLASLVSGNMMTQLLPALLFLLAIIMAFSTGTSWEPSVLCYRLQQQWQQMPILH